MENVPFDFLRILDVGGNDGTRARKAYPAAAIQVVDVKYGWDIEKQGIPIGNYNIILVNHLIEHLDDPDAFLEECKRVMTKDTILEISTPNLCAWFNRIIFLFGWLPHSYEVSYAYNVGKPFGWNKERVGGHLRVFTVKALCQLLEHHKFKILSIKGEHSTYKTNFIITFLDRVLSIRPSLASAFRIKCSL